ncbi:Tetrahydrofolate synthase [Purpureocillium takamizusanense]|uniref:Folylpolyglutamate synthase n=1 Tax=Purpureocillium takamizusanense TaxID=2060973 RepID=A0A9Q8QNK1_9HYPO|nr:Tetrahydrofolate synthase [Purpureocillium takamizusanense]UNI23443.1 Tetrahydrofolate synthase [Purpureocillium takamizusanense]
MAPSMGRISASLVLSSRSPRRFSSSSSSPSRAVVTMNTYSVSSSSSSSSQRQSSASSSRSYPKALEKLALLQSNRATTQLFNRQQTPCELNAAAIPEMLDWLRRAGYAPADLAGLRHIHVAGTKGKGSVCAYATAMLREHYGGGGGGGGGGNSVGTYTSPHLVSPRERIAIDGEPVSQDVFASAFFELWDRFTAAATNTGTMSAAEAEGPATKPFFSRFMTILAWHIFLTRGVRNVVLEVGIGGEYDATNVVPAEAVSAAVITQLGIDHVAMLGKTVEEISWHKAGVLKPGLTGFTRRLAGQPDVMKMLRARAAEKQATLVEVDDEAVERWAGVQGSLKGAFQKYNQALAVLAVRKHIGLQDSSRSPDAALLRDLSPELIRGLQTAKLRGRCEVMDQEDAIWLLDGAHTHESLDEVARWLAASVQPGETLTLVFNQQERNASQLLESFLAAVRREMGGRSNVFSHALFTRNDHEPTPPGEVVDMAVQDAAEATMNEVAPECQTQKMTNIADTVAEARRIAGQQQAGPKPKVLVTGSLHLVGGILRALEPDVLL